MKRPVITKESITPLCETKFVKMADVLYDDDRHYYVVSRRDFKDFIGIKTADEVKSMMADAVTCIVIIRTPDCEPRLLLQNEFRIPIGQMMLSPCAGLIDEEDKCGSISEALINTARREIREETGIEVKDTDTIEILNPLMFSTPGMTDECNGLVCAVIDLPDLSSISNKYTEDTECIESFELLTKADALETLKRGTSKDGIPYSIYTWAALNYFVSNNFLK